jgi:hypothetical protein
MKLGLRASATQSDTRQRPISDTHILFGEDELRRVKTEETMTLRRSHIKQEMQSNA